MFQTTNQIQYLHVFTVTFSIFHRTLSVMSRSSVPCLVLQGVAPRQAPPVAPLNRWLPSESPNLRSLQSLEMVTHDWWWLIYS